MTQDFTQQPQFPRATGPSGAPGGPVTGDERTWAVIGHLSSVVAAVLSAGWLSILGPFVVWALNKDKSPSVRKAAAGAFNFNVVIWIMMVAAWILMFTIIGIPIAILLFLVAGVVGLWCHIRAAVLANQGKDYTYPWGITVLR